MIILFEGFVPGRLRHLSWAFDGQIDVGKMFPTTHVGVVGYPSLAPSGLRDAKGDVRQARCGVALCHAGVEAIACAPGGALVNGRKRSGDEEDVAAR